MNSYKVLGLMSGTSLDGLDLAYCELIENEGWSYRILHAETVPYPAGWKKMLQQAYKLDGAELTKLDRAYGSYLGEQCLLFLRKHALAADFIASHGHTVFHQPVSGFTLQIGNGAALQAITGLPVVCDFRSQDVALGGQGAPLVPVGDHLFFPDFDACINLGGFANISAVMNGQRVAWDIGAVNTVLNFLAEQAGKEMDRGGEMARSGNADAYLLSKFNGLDHYKQPPPKSLGIEWVESVIFPLLKDSSISVADKIHTYTVHIAEIIADAIRGLNARKVLVTGGGAYNTFLLEKLRTFSDAEIIVPDDRTIQFKEALIFALLGALRVRGRINVLRSVTGAEKDHSAGAIYGDLKICK
jgi:anhydro-N-acetylmuramic acid kinase